MMRLHPCLLVLACLLSQFACADDEPTLCVGDESILFSCAIGKKVASVCASSDLSLSTGTLTYRFGAKNASPELTYPKMPTTVGSAFSYAFSGYAKGSSQELAFTIGSFRYTVYVEKHAFNESASGVAIEKDSKLVANLKCNNAFQEEENLYSLKGLGLSVAEPRNIGFQEPDKTLVQTHRSVHAALSRSRLASPRGDALIETPLSAFWFRGDSPL